MNAKLIVTDDLTKKKLVEAAHGQEFVAQAPVVIRVLGGAIALREQIWRKRTSPLCAPGCDHR
jgi:hypothetical protein